MRPGLGIIIGIPFASLFVILCVLWIIGGAIVAKDDGPGFLYGGIAALIVTLGITVFCFWPLQKEYHYWQPVEGTVAQISSRLLPSGNAMEQKYVVTLVGSTHPYGITDTRASLLDPGDKVSLSCIRQYEFGSGDHGFNCRWGAYR